MASTIEMQEGCYYQSSQNIITYESSIPSSENVLTVSGHDEVLMVQQNEMNFILCAHPSIVQDVEVVGKISFSDHRMIRARINLDFKNKQRKKLIHEKPINQLAVREKVQEFIVSLQNMFEALNELWNVSVDTKNDNLTIIIKECAIEAGRTVTKQRTEKLSPDTKNFNKEP